MQPSYRNWLQSLANSTGLPAQEARALLQVTGDDFRVNDQFVNDPYAYTGNERGQISVKDDTGDNFWYGPQGVSRLNQIYSQKYNTKYGAANTGLLGVSTTASSGTSTPSNADELALINDSMDTTNSALSRIDNERSVGLDNIINSWRESKNKLATDRGLAERDYNTTKTNTTNDYLDSRAGIRRDAGNMYNSAKRVLGAAGAGRSSALDLLLPFATGREAAIRFSDTGNKFSRNQQALDTNWGDTTRQFDEMGTSLDKQKEDKQRELEQGLLQNETSLQDQLAQLQLQRTALQGGNVTSALAGITPIRERVNSLLDRIVGLGRQYSGAVKPTGEVKFAAPTLDTYNYSKFAAPTLQGGGYDPRADYVSPLTSILQKKEKEQK